MQYFIYKGQMFEDYADKPRKELIRFDMNVSPIWTRSAQKVTSSLPSPLMLWLLNIVYLVMSSLKNHRKTLQKIYMVEVLLALRFSKEKFKSG